MGSDPPRRLPPGRQPYDTLNGARVGGLTGGILGVVATAATSIGNAWLVLVGAAAGGVIGFLVERMNLRNPALDLGAPHQPD